MHAVASGGDTFPVPVPMVWSVGGGMLQIPSHTRARTSVAAKQGVLSGLAQDLVGGGARGCGHALAEALLPLRHVLVVQLPAQPCSLSSPSDAVAGPPASWLPCAQQAVQRLRRVVNCPVN